MERAGVPGSVPQTRAEVLFRHRRELHAFSCPFGFFHYVPLTMLIPTIPLPALYRTNFDQTDTEMPILDGLSMCRQIREQETTRKWPPVPVVSLSANTLSEGWAQASEAGFSHYCGKPVNFRDLGHIILELTDPSVPHTFLRDRPMPKSLRKMMGSEADGGDDDDDDDDDDEDEGEDDNARTR